MRLAWFGPEPSLGGGVPYAATLLLHSLVDEGVEVDAYVATSTPETAAVLERPGLRLVAQPKRWAWDRWYSKNPVAALATGQLARARAQIGLRDRLEREHDLKPYDAIYQFSQLETPWAGAARARRLPPVVVHPEVHAAGELRWHRREKALSAACEPRRMRVATRVLLIARAEIQRREARKPAGIICPSMRFAELLQRDYGIADGRLCVVPNPVDTERFRPSEHPRDDVNRRIRILFASRMAVRKGVEMVVALSHRLDDLRLEIELVCVGNEDLFSDYRCLLRDLNPRLASFRGSQTAAELAAMYQSADLVLQPSHYEPFALTVGEALASGVPAVVSDEVGAAERVRRECVAVFPAGDLDAFERDVRTFVDAMRSRPLAIRRVARTEAERLFAPQVVAPQIAEAIAEFSAAR